MEEVTSSCQEQIFYTIWAFWKARAKEVDKSLLGKKDSAYLWNQRIQVSV